MILSKDGTLKILGYCDYSVDQIVSLFQARRFSELTAMDGEFTLVWSKLDESIIITSAVGAMHYFYYHCSGRFSHSDRLSDIVRDMHLDWEWDWESVGDLCELESLTQSRTLHKSIKRVPPSTILHFNGQLELRTTRYLDTIDTEEKTDPKEAIDACNKQVAKWATANPYLSLSGGFDSRVILGSMLSQGIYPTLVTLGCDGTSDLEVARSIGRKYGLDHRLVSLSVNDLLESGEHIANITNGSKPVSFWHTYLYPKKAEVPQNESFFVGTLGELARSYYFDKGVLSLILDSLSNNAQEYLWRIKLLRHRTFRDDELKHLAPQLREQLCPQGLSMRAKRNASYSSGTFLAGGSRYYFEQRVPNFYANGIRMYNDTTMWRSPFHNRDWIRLIWCLDNRWKLGSNWHRLSIQSNYPELLEFPEEKGFSKVCMLSRAPLLYWLPFMQRATYISYDESGEWYRGDMIRMKVLDNINLLNDIIEPRVCERILDEHRGFGRRKRAISFLLTIIYFRLALSKYG
jgi:asparagine synthase (glutamine-hydrolysing)